MPAWGPLVPLPLFWGYARHQYAFLCYYSGQYSLPCVMFNRFDLRPPTLHLRLPLRLAYHLFSLYRAPQFSKVGFKISRYPRVCFSLHCGHNRMVHSSLWQPPLHRRSACQSSQRRRSPSSCLPLVSQGYSRHLRSRQVCSTLSVCIR